MRESSTSSTCTPFMDEVAGNMWMLITFALLAVAILLSIISIALGAALCHSRKTGKSESASISVSMPQQGTCILWKREREKLKSWKTSRTQLGNKPKTS